MKPVAPIVTSFEISKLSGNHIELTWDDVGENFFYVVDVLDLKSNTWQNFGYTETNTWFTDSLEFNKPYKIRVKTVAEGFTDSAWVETEEFTTFPTNAYKFTMDQQLTLSNEFIKVKFAQNQYHTNFKKDVVQAALMQERFQFSPYYTNVSAVKNFIIVDNEYHEIQGEISKVCKDKERVYLMESDGIIYLFERYQNIVKVSNDKGQTWIAIKLLNDRIGYPLSRTVFYQNISTNFVLGYDKLFYGRKSNDIRWSSDVDRFSSNDISFTKMGDNIDIGFDVDSYAVYGSLPPDVAKITESIVASDDYVYVVARDIVRKIKTKQAPVDSDLLSPTFGEKLFETTIGRITNNAKAVCYKMDCVQGEVFALITGEVRQLRQDPRVASNVIDSASKGVYRLNKVTDRWVRIFGNTAEERRRIEHGYTNMSTDGKELFITSSNFRYNTADIIPDTELPALHDEVNSAVKYYGDEQYLHDKEYHMMTFRTNENLQWGRMIPGRMRYFAEGHFSYGAHSNTRTWINNMNRVVVVYSDVEWVKPVDAFGEISERRVMKETWNKGKCVVTSPSVTFDGFNHYSSGILFYNGATGEIIGFYEFLYRVKDKFELVWRPDKIFLVAELMHQKREVAWSPPIENNHDPDLVPLLKTMMPDSYLLQNTVFEKFCEYYMQFISDGYGTHYNNLLNLIKNKHDLEPNSWHYLWSEIYKRNIYLDRQKRIDVAKFFETRKNDFYSSKGTIDSYKFLFKVLYNEEVEVDIESIHGTEYDILVESDNISTDIVGTKLYTQTARCNVNYIKQHYVDGKLKWLITIHNSIGEFYEGQEIRSETSGFVGTIIRGVASKKLASNKSEYLNRGNSYYVMKIRSSLPTSRYKDDIMRFVHPVGFGFIGITMLTIFINSGLSLKHVETIINMLKNYRWSDGLPTHYYDRVAVIDLSDNILINQMTGEPIYEVHPNANKPFPLPADYNTENPNVGTTQASSRRSRLSATFDQSAVTLCQWRHLVDRRLKDDIQNPRDTRNATQIKVN